MTRDSTAAIRRAAASGPRPARPLPPRPQDRRSRRSRASRSTSRATAPSRWWANRAAASRVTVAGDPGPAAARERDRRPGEPDPVTAAATCSACRSRELRELRGNDISMIFQEPMTSLNPVFTVGYQIERGAAAAHGHDAARRRASARDRAAERGRHSRPAAAHRFLPVADVGRPAAARDDRDGDRLRAQAADRRRADHRARRHDPEADPRPDRRACRRSTRCRCCSSRTTSRVVGEIADHVVVMRNGEIREQGTGAPDLRGAAGRVHQGAAAVPPAARRSARCACR